MASAPSFRDDHLPRLSSPNLRKLDTSKLSKTHVVRSYLRSQEAHLSSYALEGKVTVASWAAPVGKVTPQKRRNVELESGLGTPVLKPRNPLGDRRRSVSISASRQENEDDVRSVTVAEKPTKRSDAKQIPNEAAKENAGVTKKRGADATHSGGRPSKRLRQSAISEFARSNPSDKRKKKDATHSHPAVVQDKQVAQEEEEHMDRLAERRERRRAKKAIVDPKPQPSHHSDSGESDDDPRPASKSTRTKHKGPDKTGKKKKGLNMPAGLALMHGFAANNIGKSRLTLRLDSTVGVFNKGKASAKTDVKRTKTIKPQLNLFSEERFLSKTKNTGNDKAKALCSQPSDAGSDLHSQVHSPRPDRDGKIATRKNPEQKRPRSPSPASAAPSDANDPQPRPKQRRLERKASPTWDIEGEDGKLPSETETYSSPSTASDEGTHLRGTVLLDTRAYTSKWNAPGLTQPLLSKDEEPPFEPATRTSSERSSIGPSHSASQVALRLQANSHNENAIFSRFFDVPKNPPVTVSSNSPQDTTGGDLPSRTRPDALGLDDDAGGMTVPSALHDAALDPACELSPPNPFEHMPANIHSIATVSTAVPRPRSPSSSLGLPAGLCSPMSPGPDFRVSPLDLDTTTWLSAPEVPAPPQPYVSRNWTAADEPFGVPMHPEAGLVYHLSNAPHYISGCDTAHEDEVSTWEEFADPAGYQQFAPSPAVSSVFLGEFEFQEGDGGRYGSTEVERTCGQAYHEEAGEYGFVIPDEEQIAEYEEVAGYEDGLMRYAGEAVEAVGRRWDIEDVEESGAEAPGPLRDLVEDDAEDDSDDEEDPSVLGSLPRFSQGRALLMGVSEDGMRDGYGGPTRLSKLEEDVARSLRGHWLPQRF